MQAGSRLVRCDEAILYGAAAVALAATVLGAGGAARLPLVGLVGAVLIVLGTLVSWRTRMASRLIASTVGGVLGVSAAAVFLTLLTQRLGEHAAEVYLATGDIGGLWLGGLLVAGSFLLLRRETILFSFVPALSIFGLIGGRGYELPVWPSFSVFLVAALVALAHAMLLSAKQAETGGDWRPLWEERRAHWGALGISMLAILVVAGALYLPIASYGSHYRLRLPVSPIGGKIPVVVRPGLTRPRSFPVGQGPVRLSETPVLTVLGDWVGLWRGEVFDLYTGRSWEKSAADMPLPHDGRAATVAWPTPSSGRVLRNVVRAERDLPFVVYSPGQVRVVTARPPLRLPDGLRIDQHGSLAAWGETLPQGGSYEVVSAPFDWRAVPAREEVGAGVPQEGLSQLLKVPLSARRVADLAREVAGDEPTPDRKLQALVAHLRENYVYTTRAPRTPRGRDAADHFLFRQKRGHCDLFATALAMMARGVGIPTRVVTGYAGGEGEAGADGYVLRESDAHAWVEAHIASRGWVSVDATPGTSEAQSMSGLKRLGLSLRFFSYDHPIVVGMLAALALGVGGAIARRRWHDARLRARQTEDPRGAVVWAYALLCHWLGRRGNRRRPAQTPLEFLVAVESAALAAGPGARECMPFVRRITDAFVRARYAPGPVTEETARQTVQAWERARRCSWRGAGRKWSGPTGRGGSRGE